MAKIREGTFDYDKPVQPKLRTMRKIGKYMMLYKWWLLLALILTLISNFLVLIGPMLSGYAIDAIDPAAGSVNFKLIFYYAGLMVFFYLASAILSYLLSILMIYISRKVVYQMRKDVFHHLLKLPVGYFDTRQTGDIISRISYDIDTVNASLSSDLIQVCTTIITVAGSLGMMIMISRKLVLVFCVTVPLSMGITKYITGKTRPLFRERSKQLGKLNGYTEEIISGQKTLQAYAQEDNTIQNFEVQNQNAVTAYYRADYYGSITGPAVNFINNLSLSFISIFGALLYLMGQMTVGNISSFILYSRKFSGPINEFANILSEIQAALSAAERVFALIDEKAEDSEDSQKLLEDLLSVQGSVSFENVCFGYEKNKPVIENLSLTAHPGQLIAIVGPTGAGKTTLINLLMRFYETDEGTISIDERNITEVTRESLRKTYAMVLQDTWLFSGTIFENLVYGREDASREEVIEAAKMAKIHNYITHLPDGYDTILSEDGTNISKGQKQLLTIARAMLLPARMLILDEATSNVDTRTELQIQQAMRKLMEGKTCFVIAHRLSTIQNADCILVVNHGKIVEKGTHKELMSIQGFYQELYQAQFENR